MRLKFVHRDGRLEAAASGADLAAMGGFAAHPAEVVGHVLEACADLDLDLWATWHSNRLPRPDDRAAVLVVIGDEAGQTPAHMSSFVCAFSNGSRGLACPPSPVSPGAAWVAALELARGARNLGQRVRRFTRLGAALAPGPTYYGFPLGPAELEAHDAGPPDPPADREIDILFLGSIGRTTPGPFGGNLIGLSAKSAARLAAARSLKKSAAARQGRAIVVGCADHPQFGPPLPPAEYRRALNAAKICLCPRGNFTETFRHAEAARAGCVVLTDRLPDEWYFADHPFVVVDDWSRVFEQADALLSRPDDLARLASASRRWYETVCSPPAVAAFMVSRIRACLEGRRGDV